MSKVMMTVDNKSSGYSSASFIPELTSIRAYAAFLVCLTHAAFWTGNYTDDWWGRLNGRWEIGVTIFFALSAFLLFQPWVTAYAQESAPPSIARYAWRRVQRILPAYWIVVGLAYLIHRNDSPTPPGSGLQGLLRTMTFTQTVDFGWIHPGLSHMWSMVIEVAFYFFLPFFAFGVWALLQLVKWKTLGQEKMRKGNTQRGNVGVLLFCVVVFGAISPLWLAYAHLSDTAPVMSRLWPMGFFLWFAVGMVLAIGKQQGWRINLWFSWAVALGFFAISTAEFAGPPTIAPDHLSEALVKLFLYAASSAFLLAPITWGNAPVWLKHPLLEWLGEISYEFFLVHVLVMDWAMTFMGYEVFRGSMAALLIVTTVISIPLAWCLRRFSDLLTRRPGPASPWRPMEI